MHFGVLLLLLFERLVLPDKHTGPLIQTYLGLVVVLAFFEVSENLFLLFVLLVESSLSVVSQLTEFLGVSLFPSVHLLKGGLHLVEHPISQGRLLSHF